MSEVAGKIATQAGAFMLEMPLGGRGLLLGGVPGVAAGKVMVIGAVLIARAKAPRVITRKQLSLMKKNPCSSTSRSTRAAASRRRRRAGLEYVPAAEALSQPRAPELAVS